jgi:glycosyltransferase 2 family protein
MCHITQKLRQHGSLLLRVGMSGGLLAWVLSSLDLSSMWAQAKLLNPWGWAAALVLSITAQSLCSVRWWTLATGLGIEAGAARMWRLFVEGSFFSLCLPSSIGGDVIKIFRLSPSKSGRVLAALSIAADRIAGLIAVLIIGLAAMSGRTLGLSAWGSIGMGAGFLLAASGVTWLGMLTLRRVHHSLDASGRLAKLLQPLVPYQNRPSLLVAAIGQSIVVQLLNATTLLALGWGLGLEIPVVAYFSVAPLVALATALPVSINGVGVREGLTVVLLREYGVTTEVGTALSLIWFTVTVTTGLLGGLVYALAPKLTYEEEEPTAETTTLVEEKELRRAA